MLNDVYIISLKDSPRLPMLLERIEDKGCTYKQTIVQAVDGKGVDNTKACVLSHADALQTAINNGLESVLIVEDDIDFEPHFTSQLNSIIELLPDNWDALWLTTGFEQSDIPSHDWYRKIKGTWGAYAYVVRFRVMDLFIRELIKRKQPTDTTYRQLQGNIACFKPNIDLVGHLDGYSERMGVNAIYS